MELKYKYKDYEEGISVYRTDDGLFEVIENDNGGGLYVYQKPRGENYYKYIGAKCFSLEECQRMINTRYKIRLWM